MSEWISVDVRLPAYGAPVLIVVFGTVQNITFFRDGADDVSDWFEPFFFEHDDHMKIPLKNVTHWQPLPEPPTP